MLVVLMIFAVSNPREGVLAVCALVEHISVLVLVSMEAQWIRDHRQGDRQPEASPCLAAIVCSVMLLALG